MNGAPSGGLDGRGAWSQRIRAGLGAQPRPPVWLVGALGALALLSVVDELISGRTFAGAVAALCFVGLHLSWPLALRSPLLGALLCVTSNAFAVATLDGLGLPTLSAVIVLVAVTASAPAVISVPALAGFCSWALWATLYYEETSAFFWGLALLLLSCSAVGSFVKLVVLNLISSRRKVETLQVRVERVRRDERATIARELHDIVAHELTLMSLQSAASRRSDDPEHLREVLAKINDTSRSALTELRTLLGVLRHDGGEGGQAGTVLALDGISLPQALSKITHTIEDLGIPLELTITEDGWDEVRFSSQEAAFRIVQEALTNVTKHASQDLCQVDISITDDHVHLLVTSGLPHHNTPSHRDPSLSSKQGLIGISERAELLGGSVSAEPIDGRWVVRATLPA